MKEQLTQFHDVVTNRHEFAKEWKRQTGSEVFGFFGDYVPEEVIRAAGILPVKIFGSRTSSTIVDAHISPGKWCSFCRDCFAEALSGNYAYLDGIVSSMACFHLQQSFDSWVLHIPIGFHHYLDTPFYVQNSYAGECYRSEIERFKKTIEVHLGGPISKEAIREAIGTYNRNRHLMRSIYESMKTDEPLLTGTEAMEMVLASTLMDKEEHNRLLERVLAGDFQQRPKRAGSPRLMIVGAETNDVEVVRMIERLGAMVVADSHSYGTRYFWNDAAENGDYLASIADRYLNKVPLPQMDFPEYRGARHAVEVARDFRIDGVIMLLTAHCDPFQWEIPVLTREFNERAIPFLVLDVEAAAPSAVTENRVQAFLEMITEI